MTRGNLLSTYLFCWLTVSLASVAAFVASWSELTESLPLWACLALTSIGVLRALSLAGVWFWSRTAVIANIVLTAVTVVISLSLHEIRGVLGAVALLVLLLLVRSKWKHMTWSVSASPRTQTDATLA